MKRLIAISSLLALVLAGSGLFAFDILDGEGEKSGFSLSIEARYGFNIETPNQDDPTTIHEDSGDPQSKLSVGVKYEGDNYDFGLGGKWEKRYTGEKDYGLDDAWGKYYLLDKQLWIRGGSMDGLWRIDTDPLKKNYGGDNGPGVQINFSPSAVTGLNVGVALPIPKAGSREITAAVAEQWNEVEGDNTKYTYTKATAATTANWGPTYPLMNAAFGLRLNGTIPNLDIGTELDLLGNKPTKSEDDQDEGDFLGMNFHLTAVYTFAPVTLKAALLTEGLASGVSDAPDPLTSAGARVIFDIPNAEGSALDLGDPWVQFQMLPNANEEDSSGTSIKTESFKDMEVAFEWEPSYSFSDQLKALLKFKVGYKSWYEATTVQKDYPIDFAVQPKLEFKFAPNATLGIHDEVYFLQKTKEKGVKNTIGFRFAWAF